MFRIKEGINLVELKKFGFEVYDGEYIMDSPDWCDSTGDLFIDSDGIIWRETSYLETDDDSYCEDRHRLEKDEYYFIHELIDAGIVESVD